MSDLKQSSGDKHCKDCLIEHYAREQLLNLSSERLGLQDRGNISDQVEQQDALGALTQYSQDVLSVSQLVKVVDNLSNPVPLFPARPALCHLVKDKPIISDWS